MNLETVVVEQGAPTLAGIKTGNLFPVKACYADLCPQLCRINKVLGAKGIRLIPLKTSGKQTLVYLYRPEKLEADLMSPDARNILAEKGYPIGSPNRCIAALVQHLKSDQSFPHEVGLFLGYPPSDVKCFMQDSRKGLKCVGCWKAYSNEKEAEALFSKYRKCTDVYRREHQNGRPLERLTVDSRHLQFGHHINNTAQFRKGA